MAIINLWLKSEIERKITLAKWIKNSKEWGPNWKKITYHKSGLRDEIKKKYKLYKRVKRKK